MRAHCGVLSPPESGLATDTGRHREINEDCARVETPGEASLLRSHGTLAVVADGMGGHHAGEVASSLAVEVICREYYGHTGPPAEALRQAFERAHAAIRSRGNGMGTTCTAVAVQDGCAHVAHVGDSRLYLIRGGAVFRMTEDHSDVMERVRAGQMTAGEARLHDDRNILLRALGSPSCGVDTQCEPFPLRPGDCLVLSTDGLHGLVEDAEIGAAAISGDPQAACARLITLARERGGYDNITVAVLRCGRKRESEASG